MDQIAARVEALEFMAAFGLLAYASDYRAPASEDVVRRGGVPARYTPSAPVTIDPNPP